MSDFPYCKGLLRSDCIQANAYWEVRNGSDLTDPLRPRRIIWKEFNFAKDAFCLQKEIRLQPNLQHPYIAPVLAAKELTKNPHKAHYVMIFEYYSVLEELSTEGLAEERIINILGMAISALVYLQSEGIAHRDIKPGNLYIAEDGSLKVGDFGTANECDTGLQTLQGTLTYMSPLLRRATGSVYHNPYKSDVYSLGLTCLQLVLGLSQNQLKAQVSYDKLSGLPSFVERLELSDGLKNMLIAMLAYEERNRPDFFKLMYLFADFWPDKRYFFRKEILRNCEICGELAAFLCICDNDLPGFCGNCRAAHQATCADISVPAADINKIKRTKDVSRLRERAEITAGVMKGLREVLSECEKHIKERADEYDKWISNMSVLKQQEQDRLRDLSDRLVRLIDQIERKYVEQRLESTLLFDHWKTISLPYAKITTFSPNNTFRLGQLSVEDEKMQQLELEERPVGPLFGNGTISILCLQTHATLHTFSTHRLAIDSETAIVLLGFSAVAGCGSVTAHHQFFSLSLVTEDIRLGETLCPRLSPAIVAYQGALYVFGGRNSMQAESMNLKSLASIPLRDLPISLSKGTPCEYEGRIYLPSYSIYIYFVATDDYHKFINVPLFDFACFIVHENRFYVFADQYTLETSVSEKTILISKLRVLNFYSCPSPILLADCVYFFDSSNFQISKYKVKNRTK